MKLIDKYKCTYYSIPYGEDTLLPYDVMEAGEEAITKKLIYLGALSIFNNYNEVSAKSLESVCTYYDLHWYKNIDINKYKGTHVRYISGVKFLAKLTEDKYFDEVEMAARDFHVKSTLQASMDRIIEEFKALLTSNALEDDCTRFADLYLSSERISFEIRHERTKAEGFDACRRMIYDIVRHARQFTFRYTRVRSIGTHTRPRGMKYKNPKTDKIDYCMGFSWQEDNRKGLFITIQDTYDEVILFDLDDNNKVTHITLIRGYMLNLYNFVGDECEL